MATCQVHEEIEQIEMMIQLWYGERYVVLKSKRTASKFKETLEA